MTEKIRKVAETKAPYVAAEGLPKDDLLRLVKDLEGQMRTAARDLEFEKAALLRDQVVDLRKVLVDTEAAPSPAGD
jgi:excinuclease ABC subunit B